MDIVPNVFSSSGMSLPSLLSLPTIPISSLKSNIGSSLQLTSIIGVFKLGKRLNVMDMPLELMIEVLMYVAVEDILAFRQVNKWFFRATYEPTLWKDILRSLVLPLPKSRLVIPDHVVAFQQMVIRAVSLDKNMRSPHPRLFGSYTLNLPNCVIEETKILPGGKHLLVAVGNGLYNALGEHVIKLYNLDNIRGPQEMARLPVNTRAIRLEAKYMAFKGKPGIMLAYVMRKYRKAPDYSKNPVDLATFAPDAKIEINRRLRYIVEVWHIPLETLDRLDDPAVPPGSLAYLDIAKNAPTPFEPLLRFDVEDTELTGLTFFEDQPGKPTIAMIQKPNNIVITDLETLRMKTLKCLPHNEFNAENQKILSMRFIPNQRQILVVRQAEVFEYEIPVNDIVSNTAADHTQQRTQWATFIELFDYPKDAETAAEHVGECLLTPRGVERAHVPDSSHYCRDLDFVAVPGYTPAPPPLNVIFEMSFPCRRMPVHGVDTQQDYFQEFINYKNDNRGVEHWRVFPEFDENNKISDASAFSVEDPRQLSLYHSPGGSTPLVIPGVYRSLVVEVKKDDRHAAPKLVRLRRYVHPPLFDTENTEVFHGYCSQILRNGRTEFPTMPYGELPLPDGIREALQTRGVGNISWDDSVGRMCVTPGNTSKIYILDYAQYLDPRIPVLNRPIPIHIDRGDLKPMQPFMVPS